MGGKQQVDAVGAYDLVVEGKSGNITISVAYLRLCFLVFDGALVWRERPLAHFKNARAQVVWNARYAGLRAGWISRDGYVGVKVCGRTFKAHRVIWAIHHGYWPDDQIDHINGDRTDNQLANLRSVSNEENQRNKGRRSDNTSGATGVYWDGRRSKWCAQIKTNGRNRTLGRFDNVADAISARRRAEAACGFHLNHGMR